MPREIAAKVSADGIYQAVVLAGLAIVKGPLRDAITGGNSDKAMDVLQQAGFDAGDKTAAVKTVIGNLIGAKDVVNALGALFQPLDNASYSGTGHLLNLAQVLITASRGLENAANLHTEVQIEKGTLVVLE